MIILPRSLTPPRTPQFSRFFARSSIQQRGNSVAQAAAVIYNVNGAPIGTAQLWQESNGLVSVEIASLALPSGTHGIHFHEVGRCDGGATAFSTAGAHYNPLGKQHGLENPNGPHAGDAPNLITPASGVGKGAFSTGRVQLTPGTMTLFDADGSRSRTSMRTISSPLPEHEAHRVRACERSPYGYFL